jgi:hypothetical protein
MKSVRDSYTHRQGYHDDKWKSAQRQTDFSRAVGSEQLCGTT